MVRGATLITLKKEPLIHAKTHAPLTLETSTATNFSQQRLESPFRLHGCLFTPTTNSLNNRIQVYYSLSKPTYHLLLEKIINHNSLRIKVVIFLRIAEFYKLVVTDKDKCEK